MPTVSTLHSLGDLIHTDAGGRTIAVPTVRAGRRIALVGDPRGATLGVVEMTARR